MFTENKLTIEQFEKQYRKIDNEEDRKFAEEMLEQYNSIQSTNIVAIM